MMICLVVYVTVAIIIGFISISFVIEEALKFTEGLALTLLWPIVLPCAALVGLRGLADRAGRYIESLDDDR